MKIRWMEQWHDHTQEKAEQVQKAFNLFLIVINNSNIVVWSIKSRCEARRIISES